MAEYPAHLIRKRYLFDGSPVTIRPIRPQDAPMEQDFVRHLSEDARYNRFMTELRELPAGKLRYFTEIDYDRHLAFVAVLEQNGVEREVGVARYVAPPEGRRCEFAVVVDDAYQGRGLAGMLMHALIDAARRSGFDVMEGIILGGNYKMIKFARQLGFTVHRDPEDPEAVRAVLQL
jgi:acetyltransferase